MFLMEKINFFIWMLVYIMYKGKWGAKPLDSNGRLSWCLHANLCQLYQGVGPCVFGNTLEQLISSFVMKHCKFWVQIFFFFSFIICVQVELLTILHKTLLKDGRALAQKAQNHKYCGMVAYVFRDMEILLFTIAEKFIINWFVMCTLMSWLKC